MSRPDQGFTLVELLVAMLISAVLLTATLSVVTGNRRLYDVDSQRMNINQNLRSALLVLSNDVRQAGELIGSSFPAIEITQGTSDVITVRRNLLSVILPVCNNINSGSAHDNVFVALNGVGAASPNCKSPDPANLATWKKYRQAQGGEVNAYIYDPVRRRGEFFVYDAEDSSGKSIHRKNGNAWTFDYDTDDNPMIIMLEQRQYRLSNGNLVMQENAGPEQAVAPNVSALDIVVELKNGTLHTANFPNGTLTWKDAAHIRLGLTGQVTAQGKPMSRTLSEDVTPRNAYSADN